MDAFKFVSSIPRESKETIDGKRIEQWNTFRTFLAHGAGDIENHSILLCSLLLGFGLEAYIAIGTLKDEHRIGHESHVWVLNCLRDKDLTLKSVYFWETTTGERMEISNSKVFRKYKSISCVISKEKFYANIQNEDLIQKTSFEFGNKKCWKSMDEDSLKLLLPSNFPIGLISNADPDVIAERIEGKLKEYVIKYKSDITFNDQLSCLLGFHLEMNNPSNANRCIVHSSDKERVVEEMMIEGRYILNSKEIGIRARVIAYPENIFSISLIMGNA